MKILNTSQRPLSFRAAVLLGSLLLLPLLGSVLSAQTSGPVAPSAPAANEDGNAEQQPARVGAATRPRIGLALGGGAARGIAHIGLLRWFEENRIPVDYIAGTSMGGLIGGAYASGLSPDEIQELMKDADWDLMFLADSPYKYKTYRRKEDARAYPGQIDFGLKGGLRLPSGLNAGQQIELMLDRIAMPYYQIRDFDELPTPFRCVATDIRKSEPLVLGSGSFSRALRATMAIPAVFTPVVLDERVLVDGGTLNNVPADVVKQMGADVAIAVNVGSSTDKTPVPDTLFGILGQTLDSMMTTGTRQALKSADLIVVPDLKGLSGMDWRRADDMVEQGYKGAAAMADQLLKYQVDEATYAEWMRARQSRRRTETPMISAVLVEGLPAAQANTIRAPLEARHAGRPYAREEVEDSILRISGSDRFEIISYTLRPGDEGAALVVNVAPKGYGPPFLLPALDIQNIDSNSFSISLRARLAVYDTPVTNSELRLDGAIGTSQAATVEWYKGLGHRGIFVSPRGYFTRTSLNGYDDDGEFLAEYRVKRLGLGFDIGHTTGMRSEVRVGYDEADVRARLRIGTPTLPEANGSDRYASIRWVFDGQNSPLVPSRGVRVRTAFRYYFDTPELVDESGAVLQRARDVPQGDVEASWFRRVGSRQRMFLSGGAGTSFEHDPGFNEFRLGGPLRLGAFNTNEIRGDNFLIGVVGVLHEWSRLPDILGGNVYLGGWLEQGSAYDRWADAEYYAAASAGVLIETIFGPAFLGYSQSLTSGGGRFYVALGPFVR
jgi:NTE family protein